MKRKDIKYYFIIVAILGFTAVFEAMKPKPIDWSFTLESEDRIPYGTYVLYQTLPDLFPGKKIGVNTKTTYEYRLYNQDISKNYIYICETLDADLLETETILQTAQNGNSVFIAAHYLSDVFLDTLSLKMDYAYFDSTDLVQFYNPKLKREQGFKMEKSAHNAYFIDIDTAKMEVLAHSKTNYPCFIRRPVGKGMIYLLSMPELLTNYSMVAEKNYEAAYACLSYLPLQDIVWDEYYKPFRKSEKRMLEIVFTNKSFKAAYTLLIITVLIFVLFTAKRRQRIIPVIKPFENKSLQFIRTIGSLYYSSKNHKDIALKKYNYLQHYVLSNYSIHLSEFKYEDYGIISEKTGVDIETVKKVLLNYIKINKLEKISQEELNTFNNHIEDFYEKCQ